MADAEQVSTIYTQARIRGMNNSESPTQIGEEQCVDAQNVEFNIGALGERRKGCTDIDLPTSITADANIEVISFLFQHFPTTDETASELWVLGQHTSTQNFVLTRKTTSWTTATLTDNIEVTSNQGYQLQGQTLHGKLFLAYFSASAVDRLHVVDQSTTAVRRAGLAEPAAPSVGNTGTPGTAYTGVRYFRVRYTVQVSSVTVLRSEPSDATTFTPSGTGTAARITKPATISEGETHWEVEASVDNATFYVIATVAVGTTTYDDSTAFTTGYAANTQSDEIGAYSLLWSAKFLAADEDRLLIGGSNEDDTLASVVGWTPPLNAPANGVTGFKGNDERLDLNTDPKLNLDGFEGGPLTFLSNPVDSFIWAFKRSHTYRLARTGQSVRAYQATKVSDSLGALPGSVVQGVNQYGMPCLYFIDPETGPCRTGGDQLMAACGRDILETWRTVNLDGIVVARALFYPESRQIHWWIATDGSDTPNLKIVLQTNNVYTNEDGELRGGWSIATGKISEAYTACMYAENIDDNTARSLVLRPFIGVSAANGYVLRCDTGTTDNGETYAPSIITRPFIAGSILDKFGVLAAALMASPDADAEVKVTLIRDFGVEEPRTVTVDLTPDALETQVIKQMRNLTGAQFYALQLQFEDGAANTGTWYLNRLDLKLTGNETA